MPDCIDRKALLETLNKNNISYNADMDYFIRNAPTVDVVKIVRCKDCKHLLQDLSERGAHLCMQNRFARRNVRLDGFCNYGERKDGED